MAPATTPEENKQIVRRIPEEVASEGNIDLMDEIFAEDLIDHLPAPFGEMRGREAAKEQFKQLQTAFPDLEVTVEDVIAEEDTVAARVTWRATHEGEFMGIEPAGREVEFPVFAFLRLQDGKVVERWIQPDQLGMMQQLGVVEPPGE
ncbi:ester cyclase [Haloferax sp. S1W]|uniref:ester cyclase n=1 Tax=Haloferax sp. S1W TaxID=3377110 RepID=UPI0037C5AA77